eukprot:5135441-Amphidinium_carterae.1
MVKWLCTLTTSSRIAAVAQCLQLSTTRDSRMMSQDTYKLETAVVTEEPRQANARPRLRLSHTSGGVHEHLSLVRFEAGVEKRLRVAFDERTLKKKDS